ncbi:MAG: hypothetical protein ABEH81_07945 [Halopenitus sp.]
MVSLDIAIHTSEGVQDYCQDQYGDPLKSADVAKVYIEQAFEKINSSGTARIESDAIPVPIEDTNKAFDACCPCYSSCFLCNYDKLYDWWKDWHGCNNVIDGGNCNILITAGGGGGRGGGDYATAASGKEISDLPTSPPLNAGSTSSPHAMWITLQEVGHALHDFSSLSDNDGDGDKYHDTGVVRKSDGTNYVTPIGVNGTSNDCFEGVPSDREQGDLRYSDCTASYFEGA